jgi:ATP-dependent Clp endopeptidase proteolytic subunit ClpP
MGEDRSRNEYECIRVEGSDVFFYSEVSQESVTELCTAVKKIETFQTACGCSPAISIHIQSEGGDLYAGLACMDFLRGAKAHVTTIVEGMCASAATFIYLGGDVRNVSPNAYVLIHQLSGDMWGKFEDMKDEMRQCEKLMRHLKKIYLKETTLPENKLDRLLKRDLYLPYKKCLKYGLIHSA